MFGDSISNLFDFAARVDYRCKLGVFTPNNAAVLLEWSNRDNVVCKTHFDYSSGGVLTTNSALNVVPSSSDNAIGTTSPTLND